MTRATSRAGNSGRDRLAVLARAQSRRLTGGSVALALAEALWLGQAAALAMALAALAGDVASPVLLSRAITGFLLLAGLRAALVALGTWLLDHAADRLLGTARADLLALADRRGPLAELASSGALAALSVEKLAALLPYLARYRPAQFRCLLLLPLILVAAAWQSWAAALIFALTGPLIPVFMALVGMAAQRLSEEKMDEIASLNGLLVERLQALVDIRLLGATPRMIRDFAARADSLRGRMMAVLRLAFLSSTVLELFAAIGVAMMAVYVGLSLLGLLDFGHWGRGLGMAQGIWLLLLAPAFYQPLRDLAAAWHDRADALAAVRDLAAEEARNVAPIPGEGGQAAALPHGPLHATGLPRLPDLTLSPGRALALTGPSGAGKTTALLMLAGLAPAPAGARIAMGGSALTPDSADGWRGAVALIPQRPHFPDLPLYAVLTLGCPGASAAQIDAALTQADATGIVARLPGGLDTRLGESGAGVSGGEARRLMIAQALLRRPAWVLADEPTADLDPDSAARITQALLALHRGGAGLIVASHDPALITAMPAQMVLE